VASHLLGVLEPSVVFQVNLDASCSPSDIPRGEKTRVTNFADRFGGSRSTLYRNAAGPESPKMLMMYSQSESASSMPSHRKLGMRPPIRTDSGNEFPKTKNPSATVKKGKERALCVAENWKIFLELKSTYGKFAASYRFGAGWQTGDCGFNLIQNQRSG
jgi:hypothetical protein